MCPQQSSMQESLPQGSAAAQNIALSFCAYIVQGSSFPNQGKCVTMSMSKVRKGNTVSELEKENIMIDKRYLNWKNKIGYGAGDIAGNVVYAFLSTYLMFYLTDTVGMHVGIVGTLMAISRLLDSITDLLFGFLLDRTNSKLGKARPWMLFGYIGCTVLLAAVFMIPETWGRVAQYAYFFITYTLLNAVFYTANNISYATLTALITKNTSERVQLGSIRYMFAFATTMIIQTVTAGVVLNLGGDATAWKRVAVIYGLIGLAANTLSALSFKEMNPEELYRTDFGTIEHKETNYTFREGIKLLFANHYFLMICGIYLLNQISQCCLGMGVYFMKYVLGNANLLKVFSWFTHIPLILGLIVTPWLVKKLRGMYKLNLVGYVLATIGRIGVLIAAYAGSVPMMLLFTGIAAFGTSPLQGDMNALVASASEYTFLTQGKRIDGSMYSCSSFGIKLGASIGTAISGWLLATAGYIENAAVQTSGTIHMLYVLYLWIPLVLSLTATVLLAYLQVEKANAKRFASNVSERFEIK